MNNGSATCRALPFTVHASIGKSGPSNKVRCEPWCSGRAAKTAGTKRQRRSWAQNFKKMVTAWRTDIGDPNLPVIMLVLKPGTAQTLKKYPYRDIVREQQLSVEMPHLTRIETIGYEYHSDDIHLTTAGQLAIGPVIAAALPVS